MSNFPVPIGVSNTFSNVPAGSIATTDFFMPEGIVVITFQPVNPNDPGVVSLYADAETSNNFTADVVILTMTAGGYETIQVPTGGGTYFFKATLGANLLGATVPSVWR